MANRLLDSMAIEVVAVPIDTTGAAVNTDWLDVKDWRMCTFIIAQGAWAAGTGTVTVEQAKTDGGTTADMTFTKRWTKVALTGTVYTETTVASNTFDCPNTANTINVLQLDTADMTAGYDWLSLEIDSPGANADLICVVAILSDGRYPVGLGGPDPKA